MESQPQNPEFGNNPGNSPLLLRVLVSLSAIQFILLFDLIPYVPSTIFQLSKDGSTWVEPVLLARINVFCSWTQRSDASEARTRGPSVSS